MGTRLVVGLVCLGVLAVPEVAPAAAKKVKGTPVYQSPHFKGPKTLPKNFVPAKPPAPVALSGDGHSAHAFVDAAGTAHVAWAESPNGAAAIMHYCRLPRGGNTCTATQSITIQQPATPGNSPSTDVDYYGAFPMAIGNELITVDQRCCNSAPAPDGGVSLSGPVYLFTSEDGGPTFTGPSNPNSPAGIIGTLEPSGGVAVFGGANPSIGIISDTRTGGTFFQGIGAGQFSRTETNMSVGSSDWYNGRVGVDGVRPIIAFGDPDGHSYVREWKGTGNVNDAAQWSTTPVPGVYNTRIAGGPKGVVLLGETGLLSSALSARRVTDNGTTVGSPFQLTSHEARNPEIAADAVSGALAATWSENDGLAATVTVHVRTSLDGGATWGPDTVVAAVKGQGALPGIGQLSVAPTADGGGFVTFQDATGTGSTHGKIQAAQFGPTAATTKPGLGLVPGGSGPPSGDLTAFTSCTQVHMGDIDALASAGCWLRDPKNQTSGAAMAQGPIRLNGLDIIPDAGVHIYIDPRQHTIETDGKVSVQLTGLTDGPIELWHGELKVTLPAVGANSTLFDFDASKFGVDLKGFPVDGKIQVKLTHDGVLIPIHVKLPASMGGVHGDATLAADNDHGIHLDSLNIGVDDVSVGGLELKNIGVSYSFADELWSGHGEAILPGPLSPDLQIRDISFQHGKFKHAFIDFGIFPGIVVYEDVYLHSVGVGIGLNPTTFEGEVVVGAQPISAPGSYAITITGTIKLQIGDSGHPTIFFLGGQGALAGFDLAKASFTYNSDGYVLFHGAVGYGGDSKYLSFKADGDIFVLHGEFGADMNGTGCFAGFCGGSKVAVSKKGIAVCDSGENAGADLTFKPFSIDVHLTSCHISDFAIAPPLPGARADLPLLSRTFTVDKGQTGVDLKLLGAGGAPNVVLVDPTGKTVAPAPLTDRSAVVVGGSDPAPGATETVIGLRKPAAGTWTVKANPGSPAIAQLSIAHDVPLPKIKARVSGSGPKRKLSYTVTGLAVGTTVAFAEKAKEGFRALGAAKGARGSLTFTPGPGSGGRRSVYAVIMQSGFNRGQPVVARYTAPGVVKPGKIRKVSVTHRGTSATVRFGTSRGATAYIVLLKASDGTATQQTIRKGHTAKFRDLRAGVKVQALVRGVNIRGAKGPVAKSKER